MANPVGATTVVGTRSDVRDSQRCPGCLTPIRQARTGPRRAAECAPIVILKHRWRQVDRAAHGGELPVIAEGPGGRVKPRRAILPLTSPTGHSTFIRLEAITFGGWGDHDRRGDFTSTHARHGPRGKCARA